MAAVGAARSVAVDGLDARGARLAVIGNVAAGCTLAGPGVAALI